LNEDTVENLIKYINVTSLIATNKPTVKDILVVVSIYNILLVNGHDQGMFQTSK